ncbi:MAG: hypothetical protein M0R76_11920, partial [Proteobacteria bacterium]|nr:hypothetical protein [Pseudomonadota bacterium]
SPGDGPDSPGDGPDSPGDDTDSPGNGTDSPGDDGDVGTASDDGCGCQVGASPRGVTLLRLLLGGWG